MTFYDSGLKETECLLTDEEIEELKKKYKTYDTAERLKRINSPQWIAEHDGISIEEAQQLIDDMNAITDEKTEEEKEAKREQVKRNKEKQANKSTSDENVAYTLGKIEEHFSDREFRSCDLAKYVGDRFNGRQVPHQLRKLEKDGKIIHTKTEQNRKFYKLA